MKKTNFKILISFVLIAIGLTSCNQTDNLSTIFLKGGKKMTNIAYHSKGKAIPLLGNLDENEANNISNESNYILILDGTETNDKIENGTFTFKLIDTTINGTWRVDGKSRKFSMRKSGVYNLSSRESKDRVALETFNAINDTYKYSGDNKTLLLYYNDKHKSKPFLMFKGAEK